MTDEPMGHPAWGYKLITPPADTLAVFGARLIDTRRERMGCVPNRRDFLGDEKLQDEMQDTFSQGIELLKSAIDPGYQTDNMYAYRREVDGRQHTLVASQNSSYGYVYVSLWVTESPITLPDSVIDVKTKEELQRV